MKTKKIRGSPINKSMSLPVRLDNISSQKPLRDSSRHLDSRSEKVSLRGNIWAELKPILCEMIIQIAKDIKPHIRIATVFLCALGIAFLASLFSFEQDPALKVAAIGASGFLGVWFFLDVVEKATGISVKGLLRGKFPKLFSKK